MLQTQAWFSILFYNKLIISAFNAKILQYSFIACLFCCMKNSVKLMCDT